MNEREKISSCNFCIKTEGISCRNAEQGRIMQKDSLRRPVWVRDSIGKCGRRQTKIQQSKGKERIRAGS